MNLITQQKAKKQQQQPPNKQKANQRWKGASFLLYLSASNLIGNAQTSIHTLYDHYSVIKNKCYLFSL